MILPEVEISVERTSDGAIFRFVSSGKPAAAMTLAVVREGESAPVWWLVPEAAVHEFPFTVVSESKATGSTEGADTPEGLSEAELEKKLVSDGANRRLGSVVYGEVPAGFRQALPKMGRPPALQPGVVYFVSVLGACQGQARFEA
jgi:hypothetical protein